MSIDQATDLIRDTLMTALIISAPMLVIGLVVGVLVSLLQTITQIQEQTLAFIPKIVAMIVAAAVLMPWISQHVVEYSQLIFSGKGH